MSTENVSLNMEYSPLNNVSSSGEEVEQYTLPSAMPNKLARPKRRRKRREFDSFKSHTINSFAAAHCCRFGNCVLASTIIILVASTCGLAVMLFYLSNNVTEMGRRFSNLQVAQNTAVSSLLNVQTILDAYEKQLQQLQISSKNHSSFFTTMEYRFSSLESQFQKRIDADKLSKDDSSSGVQKELAKLGSEILDLKSDAASLKQQELSIDGRLSELDSSFRALSEVHQQSVTVSSVSSKYVCMK